MRRWDIDIYYDADSVATSAIANDVTVDDTGAVMEVHDSYECQLVDGEPVTVDGVPVPV